jgi:acyl-[acyl-carrier-protein]-phospholipid O-acyltransferase/long-chain-fatty-acid--[acyl-carrier-protein] ligase
MARFGTETIDLMSNFFRWLLKLLYGFRAFNVPAADSPGPLLLVPNHVSWLDWLFLYACLDDRWRFVTSTQTERISFLHRWITVNGRTFPVDPMSPYALRRIAEFLQGGGRLVLFAEGRISTTGSLMKLFEGTGFLLLKSGAKVITCHLRGAERLPWVRHTGWTKLFPRVTVHFSDPITPPHPKNARTADARAKLTTWLRDRMIAQRLETDLSFGAATPHQAICETAKQLPRRIVLQDASDDSLDYRKLMVGARLLSQQWTRRWPDKTGERIGVLLPNVNATPVVLLSLWSAGKVPTILNFSTGTATMLACAKLAGLKQILTSRTFLDRARLESQPFIDAGIEVVFLEDVRRGISPISKLLALISQTLSPLTAPASQRAEDPAVILFTSGSEGTPKGVELTHRNLMSNIRQMLAVIDIEDHDRLFNALPIFHSFGLAVGTLLPLVRGIYCFLYPSPLHYRLVPTAVYARDCTVMLGTNTFLNGYARKSHPYDFRSVRYLFAGAEKVQDATFNTWASRFGIRILEGYGATECSPCVSVNTRMESRRGSAGRFLPMIEHRIEPVEGVERGGRLFVRGPNVMKGYLNPDYNAEFKSLDGWYDTGDVAEVDDDGFVHILGRLKRFAKVSGEMISLTAVEDALAGAFPQHGLRCTVAIVAQPDEERGEKLIAVTNEPRLKLDEIRNAIRSKGLSNLAFPRELKTVREIPHLGTGKINHRELAKLL